MALLEQLTAEHRERKSIPAPAARHGLRAASGLSQGDVARALGVDRATVSRWESGQRKPSGDPGLEYARWLRRLANELGREAAA